MHIKGLLLILGLIFALQQEVGGSAECYNLRAAIADGNKVYFFFTSSDRVVTFDAKSSKEISVDGVSDLFPGMASDQVDAAYHPASDPGSIILTYKDKYYQYKNGKKVKGPSPLREMFPKSTRFSKGIFAAALFQGKEHFFKGCTLVVKRKVGRRLKNRVYNLRKLGQPCPIYAAWVGETGLVMAKDSWSWLIFNNQRLSKKAYCLTDYFSTSFPMCKC